MVSLQFSVASISMHATTMVHHSIGRVADLFLRTLSFSDNMLVSLLDMARFQLDLGEIHQNFHQKLELHHDMVVSIDLIVRSVKL